MWKVSTSPLLTQLLFLSKPSLWLGFFCCSHGPLQREPLPPPNTHFTWAADSPRLGQNQPELTERLLCSSKSTSIPPAEPSPWTSSCSHPFCFLGPSVFGDLQRRRRARRTGESRLLAAPSALPNPCCCQHPHPGPPRSPHSLGPHGMPKSLLGLVCQTGKEQQCFPLIPSPHPLLILWLLVKPSGAGWKKRRSTLKGGKKSSPAALNRGEEKEQDGRRGCKRDIAHACSKRACVCVCVCVCTPAFHQADKRTGSS